MIVKSSKEFSKSIKKVMIDDDITIKLLADKMNRPYPTVSGLLNQSNISYDKLVEVCDFLGYDIDISLIKKEAGK